MTYILVYAMKNLHSNLHFTLDDDEGIVDLHGNKAWYEIDTITYQNFQGSKSTLISTHYTHHENIRIRYKRWLPTIAHSIYWFSIEKPKDYHKNLMIAWEEKRTNKTNASFNYYLGAFVHSKLKNM